MAKIVDVKAKWVGYGAHEGVEPDCQPADSQVHTVPCPLTHAKHEKPALVSAWGGLEGSVVYVRPMHWAPSVTTSGHPGSAPSPAQTHPPLPSPLHVAVLASVSPDGVPVPPPA
jgi:hypothetical protein